MEGARAAGRAPSGPVGGPASHSALGPVPGPVSIDPYPQLRLYPCLLIGVHFRKSLRGLHGDQVAGVDVVAAYGHETGALPPNCDNDKTLRRRAS